MLSRHEIVEARDSTQAIVEAVGPQISSRKARRVLAGIGLPADNLIAVFTACIGALDQILVLMDELDRIQQTKPDEGSLIEDSGPSLLS